MGVTISDNKFEHFLRFRFATPKSPIEGQTNRSMNKVPRKNYEDNENLEFIHDTVCGTKSTLFRWSINVTPRQQIGTTKVLAIGVVT